MQTKRVYIILTKTIHKITYRKDFYRILSKLLLFNTETIFET